MQDCGECAPERGAAEPVMVDCLIDRQKLCWRARIRKPQRRGFLIRARVRSCNSARSDKSYHYTLPSPQSAHSPLPHGTADPYECPTQAMHAMTLRSLLSFQTNIYMDKNIKPKSVNINYTKISLFLEWFEKNGRFRRSIQRLGRYRHQEAPKREAPGAY